MKQSEVIKVLRNAIKEEMTTLAIQRQTKASVYNAFMSRLSVSESYYDMNEIMKEFEKVA